MVNTFCVVKFKANLFGLLADLHQVCAPFIVPTFKYSLFGKSIIGYALASRKFLFSFPCVAEVIDVLK